MCTYVHVQSINVYTMVTKIYNCAVLECLASSVIGESVIVIVHHMYIID